MSVVSVTRKAANREGERTKDERTYRRPIEVVTDSRHDEADLVLDHPDVPKVGEVLDRDPACTCKSVRARQSDGENGKVWQVEAQYSNKGPDGEEEADPLKRPPEISYGFVRQTRAVDRDIDGKLVINSAKQPLIPPLEVEWAIPTLTIQRNEANFDIGLTHPYANAVNADTFWGAPPGTAKFESITAVRKIEGKYRYWVVTYEIHFKPDGWVKEPLDQGTMELVDGEQVKIVDRDGQPISEPALLDGEGRKLADPDSDPPVYLRYRVFPPLDFGVFNLSG